MPEAQMEEAVPDLAAITVQTPVLITEMPALRQAAQEPVWAEQIPQAVRLQAMVPRAHRQGPQ